MLQPTVILPSQYFEPRRLTPEHRLMIAVLHDAIDCVAKHRCGKTFRERRLFDETTQWLLAGETDWPYSFESICAVLDLDANAVRRALRLPDRPSALMSREVKKPLENHEALKGVNVAVKTSAARLPGAVLAGRQRPKAAVVARSTAAAGSAEDDLRIAG